MKIAITGGTGFVGRHLARALLADGHHVVLIARGVDARDLDIRNLSGSSLVQSAVTDTARLSEAFAGCDAVAHCAGINRELGEQTFQRVHVEGTRSVVDACHRAGVRKVLLLSFLRARPQCGSPYHESKWAAEELVRNSGLDFTVIKAGMIYGRGDHMLDHLSHSLKTLPVFAKVGFREKPIKPLPIEDLLVVMQAALIAARMPRETIGITGAEQLYLSEAARRVATVLGVRLLVVPAPLFIHRALAQVFEWTMKVPLVAKAQVQILAEGVMEAVPPCNDVPADLKPRLFFTLEQIRKGLPEPKPFGIADLKCCAR